VRRCLKEESRVVATARATHALKFSKWEDGKGEPASMFS